MNGPDPPAERRVTGRVDEKRTNGFSRPRASYDAPDTGPPVRTPQRAYARSIEVVLGHTDRFGGGNPSWNAAHQPGGCSQADLQATGGAGLFYCFAAD